MNWIKIISLIIVILLIGAVFAASIAIFGLIIFFMFINPLSAIYLIIIMIIFSGIFKAKQRS